MSTIGWVRGDDGSPGETWNPIRAVLRKDSPLRGRHRKNGDVGWFCVPVHEGCTNCYAGGMNQWRGNGLAYKAQLLEHVEFFLDENTLEEPLHWRKPRRVFPCSMTDLFGPWVKDEWLDRIFSRMMGAREHTFIVLTKRMERMRDYLRGKGAPPPNVWGGPSCSTQPHCDEAIQLLLDTAIAKRIVSLEPLLGPIDLTTLHGPPIDYEGAPRRAHWIDALTGQHGPFLGLSKCIRQDRMARLDWVIAGFESGRSAREGYISWLNSLIAQCRAAGVPLFVKQLGVKPMLLINGKPRPLDLGNRKSDPKGELSERWPPSLRVQQFPHISHNAPAQLDLGVA